MHCVYINLNQQSQRRLAIQENFADNHAPHWTLSRISAVDCDDVRRDGVAGRVRDTEKACYLSHVKAIKQAQDEPGHVFVLEDDSMFGKRSCQLIDQALRTLEGKAWDILFTDVILPDPSQMLRLMRFRRECMANQTLRLLDAKSYVFAGTNAYIVNAASKSKLLALLEQAPAIDLPLDLQIRQWIYGQTLVGRLAFPFPTTVSVSANTSQNQPDSEQVTDLLWNSFRKMMWYERSLNECEQMLAEIAPTHFDEEAMIFGKIMASYASSSHVRK